LTVYSIGRLQPMPNGDGVGATQPIFFFIKEKKKNWFVAGTP
jgi:hypothetical protein